jgi:pimeloyl-ACP methyl ester carboxylesterase
MPFWLDEHCPTMQGDKFMSFLRLTSKCFVSANFNSVKTPIVAVCGWMDGPLKPVQKYAVLFHQLGFRVVILRSTSADFLLTPAWLVHRASFQKLKSMVTPEDYWISHIMSNGGCRSWYCLEKHFGQDLNLKAMIFDSSPSFFDPDWKFPPIFFQNVSSPSLQGLLRVLMKLLMPVYELWNRNFPETHAFSKHTQRFIREQSKVPKLFMYSTGDQVVPVHTILQSIRVAEEHGNPIQVKDFKDSDHVAHFPRYPNDYVQVVTDFLRQYVRIPVENTKL